MSLIPFILDLADELHEFNRCFASAGSSMDVDDFGFGIYPQELQQQLQQQQQLRRPRAVSQQLFWLPNNKQRHHPYGIRSKVPKTPEKESSSGGNTLDNKETPTKSVYSVVNKNGFQVSMNVKQFTPNELTVKTIDNCIVVEGRHEDKEDGHGVISRHFIRKYMLPKGYDPNEVLSTMSSDGILTVRAPPPGAKTDDEPLERIVDIQQTGPAQSAVKDAAAAAAAAASKREQQTKETAQQQQSLLSQPLQPLELSKPKLVTERNGDANCNEKDIEPETAPEPAPAATTNDEQDPMPLSNVTTTTTTTTSSSSSVTIDDIITVATANAVENDANANNVNENGNATIEDNIPDNIPAVSTVPVGIPVDVVVAMDTIPDDAADIDAVVVVTKNDVVDGGIVVDVAAVENLVVTSQQPTPGDLVAAADAAILLSKTQCENGNKTATIAEEVAN